MKKVVPMLLVTLAMSSPALAGLVTFESRLAGDRGSSQQPSLVQVIRLLGDWMNEIDHGFNGSDLWFSSPERIDLEDRDAQLLGLLALHTPFDFDERRSGLQEMVWRVTPVHESGNQWSHVTFASTTTPGSPMAVPEPSTTILFGAGLTVAARYRRRRPQAP